MATSLLLSGTSPAPRGIVPPAPDNVVGWFEFASTSPAIAARNLRDPSNPALVTGAPAFSGGYVRFSGGLADFMDTLIVPATSFGVLMLVRKPTTAAGAGRVFSNFVSLDVEEKNQSYATIDNNGGTLSFRVGLRAATPDNIANNGPDLTGNDWSKWNLLYVGCNAAVELKAVNLTDNRSAVTPETRAREVDNFSCRLGTNRTAAPSNPGSVDIAAIAFCNGRYPPMSEVVANAKLMQRRAAAIGVAVGLTTTASFQPLGNV